MWLSTASQSRRAHFGHIGYFYFSTKSECTIIDLLERVMSCSWRMCCPSHKLLPPTILLYFLMRVCFLAQLNHCFVKSRLVPLTLSISFYSPGSAEPANTINYQSQCWNAVSNLEPQLNQSNNNKSAGRGRDVSLLRLPGSLMRRHCLSRLACFIKTQHNKTWPS